MAIRPATLNTDGGLLLYLLKVQVSDTRNDAIKPTAGLQKNLLKNWG